MNLFKEMTGLDKLLHEPARLAIMTALANCESADFLFLQSLTGLSKGNLSGHLSKLEEAGLVVIVKSFNGKIPNTNISLSEEGKKSIADHWQKLEELRETAKKWKPDLEKLAVEN
jgi:DNA-binding transcriptional ArsR family regulator